MDLLAVILIDDGNDGDDESRERKLPSAALLLRKGYDSQSTSHRDQEDMVNMRRLIHSPLC